MEHVTTQVPPKRRVESPACNTSQVLHEVMATCIRTFSPSANVNKTTMPRTANMKLA